MAQAKPLVHALNAGEVSAATLARVDQEKAKLWSETQENLFPFTIGKAMMRQGTTYLGSAKTAANRVREIPFVKSLSTQAGIEMSSALLRIWVDDELVTIESVTSTVTNGDFSSSTGWTLATVGDATANINSTVSGALYMACPNRGGTASCTRSVSTSSSGTQHTLKIVVTRGPVTFRCGSTSGDDDYVEETTLDTGTHYLSFTPSGSYHPYFSTRREPGVIVDSVEVASAGTMEFTAPWTETELRQIQYAESADIMYLCHINWQPRKIERRGDASWSLVLYKFEDGPFTTDRTAKVRIKPAATRGNTTLTADANFFRPEHVGTLFRITHDRFSATFGLGGEEAYTDAWRVTGIKEGGGNYNDRNFDYSTTGTWVGTVTMHRSLDSADAGFRQTGYDDGGSDPDFTSNQLLVSHAGDAEENNIAIWYRLGFEAGDYTSGSIQISITYDGHSGSGVCRVTAYNSATSVDVEVLVDFKNTFYEEHWQEGEFSDRRGWPSAVTFHDGRLVFDREDKFRASESDAFDKFNLETEGDSASIQRNVATSGAVFSVNALVSLSRLIILTDGAEVPARSDAFDAPLTATNIAMKEADNVGSARRSPAKIGKRGFFIARSGVKLYRLVYNFEQQDYDSDDITEMHEDLGEDHSGFEELAVQRHPQPYLWAVMGDGEVGILLTSPKHQIDGWIRFVTDGDVESVAIYPRATEDRVYLWVKRTINGSTVRYREKLCLRSEALGAATTKLADCGTFTAAASSTVTAAQLASETGLVAWGTNASGVSGFIGTLSSDGSTGSLSADASGNISLGGTYTNVFVGLPYRGRYKSAKLAYGSEGGTALMARKIISEVGLLLMDVHRDALRVGPSLTALTKYIIKSDTGIDLTDALAVKETHDAILQPASGSWSPDARVCFQVNAGHPATIGGIAMTVKTTS
jgi:hypothetical protein